MRVLFAMVLLLPQAAEPRRHQLDLEPLLHDAAALQKLTIMYTPPAQKAWHQAFFVRGDGSLTLQAYPNRPMSMTDIPTCREKVSLEKVKDLVRLIIQKHFFDLPEKLFISVSAAQGEEELKLRTIAIDDGTGKTSRSFGAGKWAGKDESILPDFASIEEQLKQLRDSAFPPGEKTCHFAPIIKFWN